MKKLHRQFFWLLIFLLPVQLGRHFWPEWTRVLGLPIDYLSPTFYLTDLLVFAILISWWEQEKKQLTINNLQFTIRKHWWVGAVFLYLLVTSLLAQNPGAALYKFIKIIEFTLLGFYVVRSNYTLSAIRYPLSLAVIYSSLIAIAQFIRQSTIGGVFWWLGERSFNLITPGIAKAVVNGRLVLRPYATFSHPNVLAGFILVSLILIGANNQKLKWKEKIRWVAQALGGVSIFLSFSRATWLIGSLTGFGLLVRNWWTKKKAMLGILLLMIFIGGFFYRFAPTLSGQEAVSQRFSLAQMAIKMIKANPLAGVGLNNFIPQLPNYWQQFGMTYWLQPVHNIFLLIAAETGLVGLLIFLWLLVLTFRKFTINNLQLIIALSAILALGLFDHYWFTLQQTQLLLTIIFGLLWRR